MLGAEVVYNRSFALVEGMLAARPEATIFLASGTKEGPVWLQGLNSVHANGTAAVRRSFADLTSKYPNADLRFVDADEIYQQPEMSVTWEMTVMGTHPTSLGMERFTRFWSPLLKTL